MNCKNFNGITFIGEPCYLSELFHEDFTGRRSKRLAGRKNNIFFKMLNLSTTQYESSFVVTIQKNYQRLL